MIASTTTILAQLSRVDAGAGAVHTITATTVAIWHIAR
jgi:hypothetical protein